MATHSADGGPGTAAGVTAGTSATPSAGGEGARRVLSVLEAFSPQRHTLTARGLSDATGIPLPSMYRYIALLRDTGIIVGDHRGSYHLSGKLVSLARAAEAAEAEAAESVTAEASGDSGTDGSESV